MLVPIRWFRIKYSFLLNTGHYRRILNKLPGCSIKKAARTNRNFYNQDAFSNIPSHMASPVDRVQENVSAEENGNFTENQDLSSKLFKTNEENGDAISSTSPFNTGSLKHPHSSTEGDDTPHLLTHAPFPPPPVPEQGYSDNENDLPENPYEIGQTPEGELVENVHPVMESHYDIPRLFATSSSIELDDLCDTPLEDVYDLAYKEDSVMYQMKQSTFDNNDYDHLVESDYDHLAGDVDRQVNEVSPTSIGLALSNIFKYSSTAQNVPSSVENEGEYDLLDSTAKQFHKKALSRQNSPNTMQQQVINVNSAGSSPMSKTHSRSSPVSLDTNLFQDEQSSPRCTSPIPTTYSSDGEMRSSAKNMPLPLLPWKSVIQGAENIPSNPDQPVNTKIPAPYGFYSPQPRNGVESQHLSQSFDTLDDEEDEYDTLSRNSSGKVNYRSKPVVSTSRSLPNDQETEDGTDYEVLDYPSQFLAAKKSNVLPSVPPNTPLRSLEWTKQPSNSLEDTESSCYEEVSFPFETNLALDSSRGRSMTLMAQSQKDKGLKVDNSGHGNRRLTGVQSHFQKAKAAVKKKKDEIKRKVMSDDHKAAALSDNESIGSTSSKDSKIYSESPLNCSQEDLPGISTLPHSYCPKPKLSSSGAIVPGEAPIQRTKLNRMSPVTRRKRGDNSPVGNRSTHSVFEAAFDKANADRMNFPPSNGGTPIAAPRPAPRTKSRNLPNRRPISVFESDSVRCFLHLYFYFITSYQLLLCYHSRIRKMRVREGKNICTYMFALTLYRVVNHWLNIRFR